MRIESGCGSAGKRSLVDQPVTRELQKWFDSAGWRWSLATSNNDCCCVCRGLRVRFRFRFGGRSRWTWLVRSDKDRIRCQDEHTVTDELALSGTPLRCRVLSSMLLVGVCALVTFRPSLPPAHPHLMAQRILDCSRASCSLSLSLSFRPPLSPP